MPRLYAYQCDTCDFKMPFGYGMDVYAMNDKGERVICQHPGEHVDIERITNLPIEKALAHNKAGFLVDCVCNKCLKKGRYDLNQDSRLCPSCSNGELVSTNELLGKNCPKCKEGTFTKIWNGVMS